MFEKTRKGIRNFFGLTNSQDIFNQSFITAMGLSILTNAINGAKVYEYYKSWLYIGLNYMGEQIRTKNFLYKNNKGEYIPLNMLNGEVKEAIVKAIAAYNVAFVRKIKLTKNGEVKKLEVLKNQFLRYDNTTKEFRYRTDIMEEDLVISSNDIVGGINGISKFDLFTDLPTNRKTIVDALYSDLVTDKNLSNLNNKVIANGGKESIVFSTEKELDDAEYNRFLTNLKSNYSLESDKTNSMLLDGGMKLEATSIDMNKINHIDQLNILRDKILSGLGISKVSLGIGESINRSNMQELNDGFYLYTLKPIISRIIDAFENDIDLKIYGKIIIDYKTYKELDDLREDYKFGILSKDEYRIIKGYGKTNDITGNDYYKGAVNDKQGSEEAPVKDTDKEY